MKAIVYGAGAIGGTTGAAPAPGTTCSWSRGYATRTTSGSGRSVHGSHPRDVMCQTRTQNARGAMPATGEEASQGGGYSQERSVRYSGRVAEEMPYFVIDAGTRSACRRPSRRA